MIIIFQDVVPIVHMPNIMKSQSRYGQASATTELQSYATVVFKNAPYDNFVHFIVI